MESDKGNEWRRWKERKDLCVVIQVFIGEENGGIKNGGEKRFLDEQELIDQELSILSIKWCIYMLEKLGYEMGMKGYEYPSKMA